MERILVVDDESGMRLGLTEVLERSGFAVTAVDGGGGGARRARATAATRSCSPTCACRCMTGAELLAAVQERHPGLPMVMMTAYGTVEDAVAAMKAGARDFLTKPFSPPDLVHLVRERARATRSRAARRTAARRRQRPPAACERPHRHAARRRCSACSRSPPRRRREPRRRS